MKKILPPDFTYEKYGVKARFVTEADAEFIVSIRSDEKLGRFIHASDGDVQKQIEWIAAYKEREARGEEYYFIFEKNGMRQGVARIYNINEENFTSGSWVFSPNAEKGTAVLGDIISREIAFELLPEAVNLFDIRRNNTTVQRYALSYHPVFLREDDEQNVFYYETRENFEKYKRLYTRMAR